MDNSTVAHTVNVDRPWLVPLRTKSQKLRYDTILGLVKYLHVSVQVKAPTSTSPAMRTPIGSGVTARKEKQPKQEPSGRRRRRRLRLERLAREELAKDGGVF